MLRSLIYSYPFKAMVNLCTKMAPSNLEIPKKNKIDSGPIRIVQEDRDILLIAMNRKQK